MKKSYPLDVQSIGEDIYKLMSRGHHDLHVFMAKVREEGFDWPLGMPEHIWFRTLPGGDGYTCRYVEAAAGSRGAFPVTYVTEGYGEDGYESIIAKQAAVAA